MAIVRLAKATLYGTADQKKEVLEGLQDLGCLHLIDLGEGTATPPRKLNLPTNVADGMKYLRQCPIQRRPLLDEPSFNFEEVIDEALRIQRTAARLQTERDELSQAITRLKPWGDFRLPQRGELGNLSLWFYTVPHYRLEALESLPHVWYVAARDHRHAYIVVVSSEEPAGVPVPQTAVGDTPLSALRRRFEEIETELDELHWQRIRLTRWNRMLEHKLSDAQDRAARHRAALQTLDESSVLAIQGWIPETAIDRLRSFATEHRLALTLAAPAVDESPPTLLSNRGVAEGGEDAVSFYMTPSYRLWDPSATVYLSFSLFFAMIMADAGYALVLTVLLLIAWSRLGRSQRGRRARKLFLAIALTSVAYGIAVGSFFGLAPPPGSVLERIDVIDVMDMETMMLISIFIGVLHLSLANLALAWSRRWSSIMLSSIGWAMILLGGLAFGLEQTGYSAPAASDRIGAWMLAVGAVAVLLFTSNRPLWSLQWQDHARRLLDGMLSLTGISRAFGDVLSYLRLFALGLASAQLAVTFNNLTHEASGVGGIGGLLAVLVIIFGHGLNFALAIMSGVVHGLRLNCIEFFGWSLPEEGYPFQPFERKSA